MREKGEFKKLLIASALPGEGKTFTCYRLARALARQKSSVLLIDSDLARPKLHQSLGAPGNPGLADYLRDSCALNSVMQTGNIPNLAFIPAGEPSADSTEIIANGRFAQLLEQLSPRFDWVLIDSPPVLSLSVASVIAGLVDRVLLVVQAGSTDIELTRQAHKELQTEAQVGVVLNGVAPAESYGYGYGYGYNPYHDRSRRE
jgi:tyrosine-protein kinase Etk/Wzc